jgi:LacI family transcriptional regulator
MKKRVTMRDVADLSGVSPMTVSYVVNNNPRVAPDTRARVKEAAEQLGYRLDPEVSRYMRHLATRRSSRVREVLGFLHLADNPREQEIAMIAEVRAEQLGYGLYSVWLSEYPQNPRRITRIFEARGIKGFMVGNANRCMGALDLDWEKFSVVEMGQTLPQASMHRVIGNHYKNTLMALERMREAGYRRIGFVCPRNVCEIHLNMSQSAYLLHRENNPAMECIPPLISDPPLEREVLAEWLRNYRPDAILSTTPLTWEYLQELEIRVPKDVALVEYRDFERPDSSVAAVVENREVKVTTGIDYLAGMRQRFEVGPPDFPTVMMIEGSWRPGNSL